MKFTAVFYSLSLSPSPPSPTTCRSRAYNYRPTHLTYAIRSVYLRNPSLPQKFSRPRELSLLPKSIHLKCSNSSAKSTSIATLRSTAGVCRRRARSRSRVQSWTGHFVGDGRSVNVGDNSGVGGSVQGGAEGAFGSGRAGAGDDDVETCEIEKRLGLVGCLLFSLFSCCYCCCCCCYMNFREMMGKKTYIVGRIERRSPGQQSARR